MIKAAIIADDLTGACDAGVRLKKLGYDAAVVIDSAAWGAGACDYSAIALNTGTRSMDAASSRAAVRRALGTLSGEMLIYKKIDSVLRGNIASELEACFDGLDIDAAVIAPAFPENGRTVIDGELVMTAFGKQKRFSVLSAINSDRKSASIDGETLDEGCGAVKRLVEKGLDDGVELFVADTRGDDDFAALAAAMRQVKAKLLPVGSAGFVNYALAPFEAQAASEERRRLYGGMTAVVVGSRNPMSVKQTAKLIEAPGGRLYKFDSDGLDESNRASRVKQALETMRLDAAKNDLPAFAIITTKRIAQGDALDDAAALKNESNIQIIEALADISKAAVECGAQKLILTGGDVACGVLKRLGFEVIELSAEPQPGVVAGKAAGALGTMPVATKSGGFGGENSLCGLLEFMNNHAF